MMFIVKALEILALPFQSRIAWEKLPSIELFIIAIVKALDDAIAPRFTDRNKNRGNAVIEA